MSVSSAVVRWNSLLLWQFCHMTETMMVASHHVQFQSSCQQDQDNRQLHETRTSLHHVEDRWSGTCYLITADECLRTVHRPAKLGLMPLAGSAREQRRL